MEGGDPVGKHPNYGCDNEFSERLLRYGERLAPEGYPPNTKVWVYLCSGCRRKKQPNPTPPPAVL